MSAPKAVIGSTPSRIQRGALYSLCQLGFTLETIAELLSIRVDPEHHTCQESKSIVDARLSEVESKLAELTRMRESLAAE